MKTITTSLLAGCMLGASLSAQAAVTYDFTSGGTSSTEIGSGFGNALDFGDMTVTAWGTTGSNQGTGAWGDSIETGEIYRWSTGLGACNQAEGTVGGGCSIYQHQVDNYSYDDLVLFVFDYDVTFDNIVIDPYFTTDVDVTFWIGNISSSDLTGLDDVTLLTTAGFGSPVDNTFYGKTSSPQTIDLSTTVGNALLIGGQRDQGAPDDDDYFKIASLTVTPVPVPAAVWLFGSGLLALVGVSHRKIQ